MAIFQFPKAPADQTIYQVKPGLYFIYEKANNAWVRVTGAPTFPLATPLSDGLMSAVDLRKINRLYAPLPRTTIKSEHCAGRFKAGNLSFLNLDPYVRISGNADLHNNPRLKNPLPQKYRLTLHTSGVDFGINKDALIVDLIERGQLNLRGSIGPQGRTGLPGKPGGQYDTGPKGLTGERGQNPGCDIAIIPDVLNYQQVAGATKAIVDIAVEQVSPTEQVIVLKQGVIGNPNIKSSALQVNCTDNSTWVLATPAASGTTTPIYYIDVFSLIETIKAKFESEMQRLKEGHERIVAFWLAKLMGLFDQEKSALCCALFNCLKTIAKIPKPRDTFPKPLEVLLDTPVSKAFSDQPFPAAPVAPIPQRPTQDSPIFSPAESPPIQFDDEIILTIDGLNHIGDESKANFVELEAGNYRVVIDDCCLHIGQHYSADVRVLYNTGGDWHTVQFPKIGYFTQPQMAINAYGGLSVNISHDGGEVGAYYPANPDVVGDGIMVLRFIKQQRILSDRMCTLSAANLVAYAKSWINKTCCGLITRIAGQDYIIMSYTNPETLDNADCISKFGNPALAWPTLDGENFIPHDGEGPFVMKLDKTLSDMVMYNITNDLYTNVCGCAPIAEVDGNIWVSKSTKQVIMENFVNILFPIE